MNTNGGKAGGGLILQYWMNDKNAENSTMNVSKIIEYALLPYIKPIICLVILLLGIYFIAKVMEVKSPLRGRGIKTALEYMDTISRHDAAVVKRNRIIKKITKLVEKSPLALPRREVEYWKYNIDRANILIPGKTRLYNADELHAIFTAATVLAVIISLAIILINSTVGLLSLLCSIIILGVFPMRYIRIKVAAKDAEIRRNFSDFYLMIHYVLMESSGTSLASVMKSYQKTTSSEEMRHMVDVCIHHIDTHGEYAATRYIAKDYREIPEMGKLMRLIRQANEGGDIKTELVGFRNELLNTRKYELQKKMDKLIGLGQSSFKVLWPILVQAILSAMSIYLKDILTVTTWT